MPILMAWKNPTSSVVRLGTLKVKITLDADVAACSVKFFPNLLQVWTAELAFNG